MIFVIGCAGIAATIIGFATKQGPFMFAGIVLCTLAYVLSKREEM